MNRIFTGNALNVLQTLPSESVHTCVTSPPYFGLRDYGVQEQIGVERTPDDYIRSIAAIFREVHRVMRDDGTLWLKSRRQLRRIWQGCLRGRRGSALRKVKEAADICRHT